MSSAEDYDPQNVRQKLPNDLNDKQVRGVVCAVRNPDAAISRIADEAGVSDSTVSNALEGIALDLLGRGNRNGEVFQVRDGERREAETYDELTPKQQAVIDHLARYPSFEWQLNSSRALRDRVYADPELDFDESIHYTYPKRVAAKYQDLVPERRAEIDTADGEFDESDEVPVRMTYSTARELLEQAGLTDLPDENLDAVPAADAGEHERLELAYRRGEDTEDEGVSRAVPYDEFADRVGTSMDPETVSAGDAFFGVVNSVVDWGVWVTIGGDPSPTDVSGVIPVEQLDDAELWLRAFSPGDTVPVIVTGRSNTTDDKVRFRLDLPTWYTDHDAPIERQAVPESGAESDEDGDNADGPDHTDQGEDDAHDAERPADDAESDTAEHPLASVDEIRAELDELHEAVSHLAEHKAPDGEVDRLKRMFQNSLKKEALDEIEDLHDRMDIIDERIDDLFNDQGGHARIPETALDAREHAFYDMLAQLVDADDAYAVDVELDGFGRYGGAATLSIKYEKP